MSRRVRIIIVAIVLGGIGLFVADLGYFHFFVVKPGVQKMIEDAERGDAEMQLTLGAIYERPGEFAAVVKPDAAKSVYWYQKAADQGHAQAEMLLALAYAGGKGVRQDNAEVVRWMRRAAEHGSAEGQMMLGRIFDKGYNGVVRNEVEAARWYRMAAENGQAEAQRLLRDLQRQGGSVAQ